MPAAVNLAPPAASFLQVMRLWPFRQAILRSGARGSSDKYALPCSHLYHFGANDGLRGALQLTNLLTGWVHAWVGGQAGGRSRAAGERRVGRAPAPACPLRQLCTRSKLA